MNYSLKTKHRVALNLSLSGSKQGNLMELIDIITEILVFGGALLALTVIFSFYISKKKMVADTSSQQSIKINSIKKSWHSQRSIENEFQRKINEPFHPQIFQIGQSKQLDIRIIPKSSTSAPDPSLKTNNSERPTSERNGTSRYKIINDELRKTEEKAVNFYL